MITELEEIVIDNMEFEEIVIDNKKFKEIDLTIFFFLVIFSIIFILISNYLLQTLAQIKIALFEGCEEWDPSYKIGCVMDRIKLN